MDLSMFALTGKVAIVTGGGRGIGRALAMGLAEAGADVAVAARTVGEIEATAAEIENRGGKALAIPTDVRDVDQVAGLLHKTIAQFGRVDILVNNAGAGNSLTRVVDMSAEAWEAMIGENLNSVFKCCKIIGEVMMKRKAGNIINLSSVAGLGPFPRLAAYAAAKAGIINLTKTLAVELAPYNIRINAIAPGFLRTAMFLKAMPEDSPRRRAQLKCIPLRRFGSPEDIVGVTIFLASDASAYVTGETIVVDGGLTTTVFSDE